MREFREKIHRDQRDPEEMNSIIASLREGGFEASFKVNIRPYRGRWMFMTNKRQLATFLSIYTVPYLT